MNLFAYGTLMWPEVLGSVIGRRLEGVAAVLNGYERMRMQHVSYPGLVPAEGSRVNGVLYSDLSNADFEHLDRFEGDEYERVQVCLNGQSVQVYVVARPFLHRVEPEPWYPEHLNPGQLAAFCREYKGWAVLEPRRDADRE